MNYPSALAVALALAVGACASGPETRATIAPETFAALSSSTSAQGYRIGPMDLLSVNVLGLEDLSFERLRVDASGKFQYPLLGSIQASGMTVDQLARLMEGTLRETYLQDPRVSISVMEAASQKVTVDGAVTEPGVFEMKGNTSLVQAIAMAKGPTRVSNLERVAVFRTVDGQRMVAVFDLNAIRAGQMPDVSILGDDVIIVDTSQRSVAFRELISVLPALAFFRPY